MKTEIRDSIRVSDVLRAFAPAGGWLAESERLKTEAQALDAAALGARSLSDWDESRRYELEAASARARARLAEFAAVIVTLQRPEK